MNENLKDYISEDDPARKAELSEKLLNESTESFYDECFMSNMLKIAHGHTDISGKIIKTIEADEKLDTFADGVLNNIKKNRFKNIFYYVAAGVAALLVLGLVLNIFNHKNDQEISKNNGGAQQPEFKVVELPEGVKLKVYNGAAYEFVGKENEFLKLSQGTLLVDVESRVNKKPLYFVMNHAKVKVTGTSFILKCDEKISNVTVNEGEVDFIEGDKAVRVKAQQTVSSKNHLETVEDVLDGLVASYSFENLSGLNYEGNLQLAPGVTGQGLKFDGHSKVIIPRSAAVEQESISIWFKNDTVTTAAQTIINHHRQAASADGFNILLDNSNSVYLQLKNHFQSGPGNNLKTLPEFSKWYHVVFTRDKGGNYSFYVNGELINSDNFIYNYQTENIQLGRSPDKFWVPFSGYIDELKIYNRPISLEEVKKLYKKK